MPSDTFTPPALDTKEESGSFSPPPLNSKQFVPPPVDSKTGLAPVSYNHPEETLKPLTGWRGVKFGIEKALSGVFPGYAEKGTPSPSSVTGQALMVAPLGLPKRLGQLLMTYFAGSTAYQQPTVYRQIKEEIKQGDYTAAQRTAVEDFLNIGIVGTGVASTFGKEPVAPVEPKVPPVLEKTAPATAEALKTTLKQGGKSASDIASATGVPEPEIRPSVGEATPLRQPGEDAPAQSPLQQGEEATPVTPAIQTTSGEVVTGKDHVSAYEKAKETVQPDTSGSKEGFVDNATGKFITREEAAEKTGLPTKTEPGKLHSSDLPPSEPAKSVPSVTKKNTQQTAAVEPSPIPSTVAASKQRDWDIFNEDLRADLDSFSPARSTGKTDYDLMDVADRFVEFARKQSGERPILDLFKEFSQTDEARKTQLSKLKKSLISMELPSKPGGAIESKTPAEQAKSAQNNSRAAFEAAQAKAGLLPLPTKEPMVAASFRLPNGQVFSGIDHMDAAMKAEDAGLNVDESMAGFTGKSGKFYTRDEAFKLATNPIDAKNDDFAKGELHTGKLKTPFKESSPEKSKTARQGEISEGLRASIYANNPEGARFLRGESIPQTELEINSMRLIQAELDAARNQRFIVRHRKSDNKMEVYDTANKTVELERTSRLSAQKAADKMNEYALGDRSYRPIKPIKQSKSATPKSEPVAAATSKVADQIQTVANTEGQRPAKEVKSELVSQIEQQIRDAKPESEYLGNETVKAKRMNMQRKVEEVEVPLLEAKDEVNANGTRIFAKQYADALARKAPKVTIDIPGDGTFTVFNTKEALSEMLTRAKRLSTSSTEAPKVTYRGISKEDRDWIAAEKAKQPQEPTPPEKGEIIGMGGEVPSDPAEVLNSSDNVKVIVPKGATMLRVHTESVGKTFAPKVISKSELEKGNIFKGSGVSKIEAGTMSGKDFIPMKGKVSIKAKPEKVMKAGPGAATKSPIDVESDIGRNVTNIPPLQKLADAVKDFPQQRGGGFRESLRQWKESVGIPFKDTFANALTNVKAQTARLVKSITTLPEVTDIERRVGVWDANDQEGSMVAQNFSKEIRRQFKDRSKLRALANYIDAQGDMGLLRKRADATKDPKLKKTYEDALNFGDAEKRFAAEIQQYHDEMLSIAQEHGALEEGVDNYIHRIYREKDPMLEKQKANLQYLRFTKNFNGFKKRFYATDFEAEQAGLKPEKDIAKRILAYDQGFRRALTARAFVKASFEATMPDGRPELDVVGMGVKMGEPSDPKAILIKPKWRQNSDDPIDFRGDYVPFDHPAFQRWKFATKDEAGKPILVEGQILVHPNAAKKYAALFDKSWWQKTPVRRGVLKTSQVVKQTMLSISGFHPVQIAVHALEHRVNPFKIVDLVPHDPKQRELMEGGLTVADVKGEQIFSEGVYGTGLTEKIPILGEKMALTRDWLFKDFIPRVKMTMALKALDRKMENRSQDLASGKVTREQLVRQTAREANAAFGEQNYRALFRHPTFQDWLRFGFLAPDFGEARIRFPLQALTRHGTEQRNALILGAVGMAVIAKIVEHELTGQTRMDRPFTVTYKGHEYGLRNVASDLYKLVTEPNAYIRNRLNPIYTRSIMEFVTGRDAFGRTRTKAQQLLDEAKTIIPISARGLVTKNQQWWESFMNAMGMTERQRTSFSDIMKKVNDWKATKGYESPAEFVYDPDKDPYSDLTHELVLGSDQRATREINRLVQGKTPAEQFKVYDHFKRSLYQRRYLTGSKEHEKEFVDSLSPGDKKLYNEAKQERSEMWQRFVRAWKKRDSNLLSTKDNADWEELMKEAEQ